MTAKVENALLLFIKNINRGLTGLSSCQDTPRLKEKCINSSSYRERIYYQYIAFLIENSFHASKNPKTKILFCIFYEFFLF